MNLIRVCLPVCDVSGMPGLKTHSLHFHCCCRRDCFSCTRCRRRHPLFNIPNPPPDMYYQLWSIYYFIQPIANVRRRDEWRQLLLMMRFMCRTLYTRPCHAIHNHLHSFRITITHHRAQPSPCPVLPLLQQTLYY